MENIDDEAFKVLVDIAAGRKQATEAQLVALGAVAAALKARAISKLASNLELLTAVAVRKSGLG